MIKRPHEFDYLFWGQSHSTGTDGKWTGGWFDSLRDALSNCLSDMVWEVHDESQDNILVADSGLRYRVEVKHEKELHRATFKYLADAIEWVESFDECYDWRIEG